MSNEPKSTYKDLLSSIDQLNTQETTELFVPSAGRNIAFTPLTVKQQKTLLSTGVDTDIENLSFVNALNGIIQDNCTERHELLVLDRPLMALQLRAQCVGNDLKIVDPDDNTHVLNVNDHVKKCISRYNSPSLNFDVSVEGVNITCAYPSLSTDIKYNKQFTKSIKKSVGDESVKLTDIVGDMYIFELLKFVKTISINDTILEFDNSVSITQKIEVFEALPMKVSTKLADQIKDQRDFESKCVESEDLPEDVTIPLDATLFTGSD